MIDFHVHIFPEPIAEKTIRALAKASSYHPYTNGMREGILKSVMDAGLEQAVLLPVVTNPKQFDSVHRFAMEFREGPLLSFGGIHPECSDYKEKINQIRDWGFRGIKLHPDYQETYFDDIRYKRIISYATEQNLIVVTHAGVDPAYPNDIHCTPKMVSELVEDVKPEKLVLAHMGGFRKLDELAEYVVGRDVYLDTAMAFGRMEDSDFIRITRSHGIDKILFATDSPWSGQKESIQYLKNMDFTEEEKTQILEKNAKKLLTK